MLDLVFIVVNQIIVNVNCCLRLQCKADNSKLKKIKLIKSQYPGATKVEKVEKGAINEMLCHTFVTEGGCKFL